MANQYTNPQAATCSEPDCRRQPLARGLCGLHYQRSKRGLTRPITTYADTSAGDDACWPWMGRKDADGYGVIGTSVRAHRVAWAYSNGEIPHGMVIMHTCDNPPCCNPSHLRLGTYADNAHDRDCKARSARGERSGMAKLTEIKVSEIRSLYEHGTSIHKLSRDFHVSRPTIKSALRRKTWAHVV